MSPAALLRTLHLASPTLPIGAYSYSQGMEAAIDAGIIADEAGALAWIRTALASAAGRLEAPVFLRLFDAWRAEDPDTALEWSRFYLAARDTAEFRAETLQMGYSLARLAQSLAPERAGELMLETPDLPFPAAFAAACVLLDVPREAALAAMLFSTAENQVLAAMKAIPLGQAAGQRMLFALHEDVLACATAAAVMEDEAIGNWAPGLSQLSMRHETQHSRIFRS